MKDFSQLCLLETMQNETFFAIGKSLLVEYSGFPLYYPVKTPILQLDPSRIINRIFHSMLIIISDLHLTDGTSGTTIGPSAFEIFKDRITDMAIKASWRKDENGKKVYSPIKRIDIILLGDVLDIIRSKHWSDAPNGLRPWSDFTSPEYISMVKKINKNILSHNEAAFAKLRALTQSTRGMGNEGENYNPHGAICRGGKTENENPIA